MPAAYPSAIKSFTTKVDGAGNVMFAVDVNGIQDEVIAIEQSVIGGPAAGQMWNGQIVTSVTSNNITVALKTMAGANPSASAPVMVRIGNSYRAVTAALSVTKNAGTNWCNSGGSELATQEVDYFVYMGYNATDGVVLGFARIPYAQSYGDFSTTSTNERYCAISTITNATATDVYDNVGRFNAILSATANFFWSIPGTSVIINRPITETRMLTFVPTITYGGGTTNPTSNTLLTKSYQISSRMFSFLIVSQLVKGTGDRTSTTFTLPLNTFNMNYCAVVDTITAGSPYKLAVGSMNSSTPAYVVVIETMAADGYYLINVTGTY
jgi:hypothetical protein